MYRHLRSLSVHTEVSIALKVPSSMYVLLLPLCPHVYWELKIVF